MVGSYGSSIITAKRISTWTGRMMGLSAWLAISSRLKKKSVYQPGAMVVIRGRMFTAEVLAAGANVVM